MKMKTKDLLRQLKTKDIAVFGTGFVAEMFYEALQIHDLTSKIRCFVVSQASQNQRLHDRPVYPAEGLDLPEGVLLCVAVHESAAKEVMQTLKAYADRTVWIYPNLLELLYGMPDESRRRMPLVQIMSGQDPGEHWLSVRYAAVRDYLNGAQRYPKTKDLYLRAMALHCQPATALRRLRQAEELADSIQAEGFHSDSPVCVDDSGRIIDGLHRVCCAAYLRLESIPVTVYPSSPVFDRVLGDKNRLPERILLDEGFSAEEILFLREAWHEMTGR